MATWYRIVNKSSSSTEVLIYDEIGYWGISSSDFVRDFNAISTPTITLRINSPGGSVFDGFAIHNAIKAHKADVNVFVDACAASIASVIALAGDTICVAKNAMMMIHNPIGGAYGHAPDLRKTADLLDKLRDSIVSIYAEKTGKSADAIKALMDAETWFNATECKDVGLCDSIGDGDEDEDAEDRAATAAAVARNVSKFTKAPERIRQIAALATTAPKKDAPGASSTPPPTQPHTETPMAAKIVNRDGKQFVVVDGKEHEVEAPAAAPGTTVTASADALEAAKREGAKQQREYDAEFTAAVASAGLTGKEAEKFKDDFYDLPIKQVKFLASCAIGLRAKASGEGASGDEGKKEKDGKGGKPGADDSEATLIANEGKRFDEDLNLRKAWSLRNTDPTSAEYKAVRERFIAAALRDHRDEMKAKSRRTEMATA